MQVDDISIGILIASSPGGSTEALRKFAEDIRDEANAEILACTTRKVRFQFAAPVRLADDETRRPSDFLDAATLAMTEGPHDLMIVITDAPLTSRNKSVVAGLASRVARVAVLSVRRLIVGPRHQPLRDLGDRLVTANGAALLLHLFGHLFGLPHTTDRSDAMAPYLFDENRIPPARYTGETREQLRKAIEANRPREMISSNPLRILVFHLDSIVRHPFLLLSRLIRNRALTLPLALSNMTTVALVPTLVLVFTAEIWDVGMNMSNRIAGGFALATLVGSTVYLTSAHNLFFPREEKRVLNEHMALVNSLVFLTMLFAMVGLFLLIGLFCFVIVQWVFPPGLIATWPTLQNPDVDVWDKARLSLFIATLAVMTGALAGGLDSRTVIRHLALFEPKP